MRPKRSTAASTTPFTCAWSVTSPGTASASEPARSISPTQFSSASPLRAVTTTLAPRSPAPRAIARPRPLEAPVTTITCSRNGFLATDSPYPRKDALRFGHAPRSWNHRAHRDLDRRAPRLRPEAAPGDRALARQGHARVQGLDHRQLGRQGRAADPLRGRVASVFALVAR